MMTIESMYLVFQMEVNVRVGQSDACVGAVEKYLNGLLRCAVLKRRHYDKAAILSSNALTRASSSWVALTL